ncbi:MAG TPA: hypothetical protein VNQ78_19910, partial [Paracoccus sp. (in: a-proteobacteria)]|uniref:hypothetical protein n=1 Tax=Paracoccus sp. TaxID=267 RepID=UPI002D17179D
LPWLLGKKGLSRSICASLSQKKLPIGQFSLRSLKHAKGTKSMGLEPNANASKFFAEINESCSM